MTTIALSSNAAISAWQTSTANAKVVTEAGATLSGMAAAAYSFGEALMTVKYQGLLDGLQLADARFEFPAGSNQWVSLSEVADALHYKYGFDPLIELAPGMGFRGFSVADINAVLERLNQEFKGQFRLTPITGTSLEALKTATNTFPGVWTPVAPITDSDTDIVTFSSDPNWSSGTPVRVGSNAGGLAAGTDYFVRNLGGGNYSFFASAAAASGTSSAGRIDLTGSVAEVSCSSVVSAADTTNQSVSFTTDPNWASGTPVRGTGSSGGLVAGTDYFVRSLGGGKYSFFDTQASATGTAATGRVAPPNVNSAVSFSYNLAAVTGLTNNLLDTTSSPNLAPATETELRENLTDGGDLYVDRRGAFFINGVPTTAMDVAVVSRLLAQDNISSEYKVLMDDYTERNNLITAARTIIDGGFGSLLRSTYSLSEQYGIGDVLSELTSGQYSDSQITPQVKSTDTSNDTVSFYHDPAWRSGTKVEIATAGGGLSATNSTSPAKYYYVRNLGQGNYSFYTYPPDATANPAGSTLVDLTSAVSSEVWPAAGQSQLASQLGTSTIRTKFPQRSNETGGIFYTASKMGWVTGAAITFSTNTTSGLVAGREYYIRNEGIDSNGTEWYGVFDTYAHAIGPGEMGRLSSNNSGPVTIFEPDILRFASDPLWVDGTRVRVEQTECGLVAEVDYYARSLGSGRYSLFTSAASAKLTGSPRPTVDQVDITGGISFTNRVQPVTIDAASFDSITALLNTLISNKVRDGDLDQAKLQTLTAQLQNNTEAMTAMLKVFSDLNATLAQALR
jgi:hypothetical protein